MSVNGEILTLTKLCRDIVLLKLLGRSILLQRDLHSQLVAVLGTSDIDRMHIKATETNIEKRHFAGSIRGKPSDKESVDIEESQTSII